MAKTASHCRAVLVTSVNDAFKERRQHSGRSKIRFLGITRESWLRGTVGGWRVSPNLVFVLPARLANGTSHRTNPAAHVRFRAPDEGVTAARIRHPISTVTFRFDILFFWLIVSFCCPVLSRAGFKICVRRRFRAGEEPPIEEKLPNSHFPADKLSSCSAVHRWKDKTVMKPGDGVYPKAREILRGEPTIGEEATGPTVGY